VPEPAPPSGEALPGATVPSADARASTRSMRDLLEFVFGQGGGAR